jgi:hypothetical protein
MKIFLGTFLQIFLSLGLLSAKSAIAGAAPQLVYIGALAKDQVDGQFLRYAREWTKACSQCVWLDRTPYSDKGLVEINQVSEVLKDLKGPGVLLFNLNLRVDDGNKILVDQLSALSAAGWVIVGPSGHPPAGQPAAPLSRTVLGKVPQAVILGERNERDRLFGIGFFGPEMLTALRMPKDYMNKDLAAVFFAARLAVAWNRKESSGAWVAAFKNKRTSTRKLWLDIEDFFGS